MKKYIFSIIFCFGYSCIAASEMSTEKQYEVIENYMYVTGQLSNSQSTAFVEQNEMSDLSGKCGMSAVRDFKINYDKFDKQILKSSGVQTHLRPDFLTDSIVSPSGKFLIHFSTSGPDAVYSNVPGGSFGYIDSVARIFDEVYSHVVDSLGYPAPIHDSFYVSGGDEKYDVYLVDIPGAFYGLAYADTIIEMPNGDSLATAYLELDNDYVELTQYVNRPLDAVRVTAAHEFFHMVHFAIDFAESEIVSSVVAGPAWMEMSAVWMEEEIYDQVNDYYNYLPFFFAAPWASIQQFNNFADLHAYASALFPMFLSQKYDSDIVKSIWTKCGEYGPGPHFLQVVAEVVDSASAGSETYETAFGEFALWNYFTGSRSDLAPDGVGYSERASYVPEFTDDLQDGAIEILYSYPKVLTANLNDRSPISNGSYYLALLNVDDLVDVYTCLDSTFSLDTTYWICDSSLFPNCTDSTEVTVFDSYDTLYIDSFVCNDSVTFFQIALALDPNYPVPWSGSIIYRYNDYADSIDVDTILLPPATIIGLRLVEPSKYSSITFALSAASSNRHLFLPNNPVDVGYIISSTSLVDLSTLNADASIFYPFPNPAVYKEMSNKVVNFKFQYPTDSAGFSVNLTDSLAGDPYIIVDIYNVNGEYIRTIDEISNTKSDIFSGIFVTEWDMKNQAGKEVSSGVYFAYARLFAGNIDGTLLFEKKTKIAVIR